MTEKEMMKISIEEFSRLQKYMILTQDKESAAYKEMYERYTDLKAILTTSGVNLTDIDRIKAQEAIKITIKQKIESACAMAGITVTELGRRVGMSQANISKRLKVGKFTQEELEAMGKALGAQYKSGFYFPDGNKVE